MKIVFDSEEERDDFVGVLSVGVSCPGNVLLPEDDNCNSFHEDSDCYGCWLNAIKSISEVKPNDQG